MADREVLPTPGVGSIEPSPLSRVLDRLGRWRDDLDAVVAAAQFSAGRSSGILTVAGELDASVAQVQRVMLDAVTSRRSAFQVVSLPPEDGHVGLDLLVWSARAGVAVALGYRPLHDGDVVRRRSESTVRSLLDDLVAIVSTQVGASERSTVVDVAPDGHVRALPSAIGRAADLVPGDRPDAWPVGARVADAIAALRQGTTRVVEVWVPGPDPHARPMRLVLQHGPSGAVEGMLFPYDSPVVVLPPHLAARLTPREREIAALLVGGRRSTEIARALFISWHTCRNHTKAIFGKLGVHTLAELVDLVRSAGAGPDGVVPEMPPSP